MSEENTKWILYWDAGYGKSYKVSDIGSSKEEAEEEASACWEQESQDNADYGVMKWTEELEDMYVK